MFSFPYFITLYSEIFILLSVSGLSRILFFCVHAGGWEGCNEDE
jgi:hypothetical protein